MGLGWKFSRVRAYKHQICERFGNRKVIRKRASYLFYVSQGTVPRLAYVSENGKCFSSINELFKILKCSKTNYVPQSWKAVNTVSRGINT